MEVLDMRNPLFDEGLIHPFQAVSHLTAFVIGVPLNVFVAVILLINRWLHKARNAIWLGVIFSNLSIYFLFALKYFTFYNQSYVACRMISFLNVGPYLILLINLLLATCERLVYTKRPLLHRRFLTASRVVIIQLTCSLLTFLAISALFWLLDKPVRCGVEPAIVQVSGVAMLIITLTCVALQLIVLFLVNKSGREVAAAVIWQCRFKQYPLNGKAVRSRSPLVVHYITRRAQRMERNATVTVVIGLIPLCLFTLPPYLYALGQLTCGALYRDCDTFNSLQVYFRELIVAYTTTNLLVYVFFSSEFRSEVKRMFRCLTNNPV